MRLHELLVGARGHGGKLASDAADRWSLLLALAQIYIANARGDDARATLGVLPPEESLPAELQQELQQLRKSLSS